MLTPKTKGKPVEEILDVSPLLRLEFITFQLIGKSGIRRKSHARALGTNKSLWLATTGRGIAGTKTLIRDARPEQIDDTAENRFFRSTVTAQGPAIKKKRYEDALSHGTSHPSGQPGGVTKAAGQH